jgi:hypothetical protein
VASTDPSRRNPEIGLPSIVPHQEAPTVGTRSVIARPSPEGGFHGSYCHYDGYPAHQGRVLFEAVTGPFAGDPDAACQYLIDQHPAGWSVLYGDFTLPPGYQHHPGPEDRRNQGYCPRGPP